MESGTIALAHHISSAAIEWYWYWTTCTHSYSKWYKLFCSAGCSIEGTRYTGADNSKLDDDTRAKRFTKYLQVWCNLHRGHDVTYLVKYWFRWNQCSCKKRRNERFCRVWVWMYILCTHILQCSRVYIRVRGPTHQLRNEGDKRRRHQRVLRSRNNPSKTMSKHPLCRQ